MRIRIPRPSEPDYPDTTGWLPLEQIADKLGIGVSGLHKRISRRASTGETDLDLGDGIHVRRRSSGRWEGRITGGEDIARPGVAESDQEMLDSAESTASVAADVANPLRAESVANTDWETLAGDETADLLMRAEALQVLRGEYRYHWKTLAALTHRSTWWVRATVNLVRLPEQMQQAFRQKLLAVSEAQRIAALPTQPEMLKEWYASGGPRPIRQVHAVDPDKTPLPSFELSELDDGELRMKLIEERSNSIEQAAACAELHERGYTYKEIAGIAGRSTPRWTYTKVALLKLTDDDKRRLLAGELTENDAIGLVIPAVGRQLERSRAARQEQQNDSPDEEETDEKAGMSDSIASQAAAAAELSGLSGADARELMKWIGITLENVVWIRERLVHLEETVQQLLQEWTGQGKKDDE